MTRPRWGMVSRGWRSRAQRGKRPPPRVRVQRGLASPNVEPAEVGLKEKLASRINREQEAVGSAT